MIGELQLILTVRNKGMGNELCDTQLLRYTAALVKLLQWYQRGDVNLIYGMVEFKPWPKSETRNQKLLLGERIYSLAYTIRGAHVVLTKSPPI